MTIEQKYRNPLNGVLKRVTEGERTETQRYELKIQKHDEGSLLERERRGVRNKVTIKINYEQSKYHSSTLYPHKTIRLIKRYNTSMTLGPRTPTPEVFVRTRRRFVLRSGWSVSKGKGSFI